MKKKQDNRERLLELEEGKNYSWSAKFLSVSEKRFTISQLRLKGEDEVLASHLNLPVSMIFLDGVEDLKKGQELFFDAGVGVYVQQGWRRGTLKVLGGKKIKITM